MYTQPAAIGKAMHYKLYERFSEIFGDGSLLWNRKLRDKIKTLNRFFAGLVRTPWNGGCKLQQIYRDCVGHVMCKYSGKTIDVMLYCPRWPSPHVNTILATYLQTQKDKLSTHRLQHMSYAVSYQPVATYPRWMCNNILSNDHHKHKNKSNISSKPKQLAEN